MRQDFEDIRHLTYVNYITEIYIFFNFLCTKMSYIYDYERKEKHYKDFCGR